MIPANDNHPTLSPARPKRDLRLQVAGGELLLNGRFSNWVPLAIEGSSKEGGTVQLVVDVTSFAPASSTRKGGQDELFVFTANDVKRTGRMSYRVLGTFTSGRVSRELEMVMQAPPAHSPFMVLNFTLPQNQHASFWRGLNAQPADVDETSSVQAHPEASAELRAQGWLRPPAIAAA